MNEFETHEVEPPASHLDLLEGAHFGHLSTVRPDGSPQGSVMWFEWDGSRIRFTHTRERQKTRNIAHEPRISLHIQDPESAYRTLEIRGVVESVDPDTADAAFYRHLQQRYGRSHPVRDAVDRIVITMRPTRFVAVRGGLTTEERRVLDERLASEPDLLDPRPPD